MKIGLVCSAGGHLTQMQLLLDAFTGHEVFFVTYEGSRIACLRRLATTYTLRNFGSSPLRLLSALPAVIRILLRERPQLIVSTGSEIALPFFFLAKLVGIRTVYIESFSRVEAPSKTGKLLYPIADVFLVQWPALLSCYGPKARYEGGIL